MRKLPFWLLTLMNICLLTTLVPCASGKDQKMSQSEYQSFIKHLGAAIPKWERLFSGFKVEQLPVSYAVGKQLEDQQELALKQLYVIKTNAALELNHPRLRHQISIEQGLSALIEGLSDIESLLPTVASKKHWDEEASPIMTEVANYRVSLDDHVWNWAEELQNQAESCTHVNGSQ